MPENNESTIVEKLNYLEGTKTSIKNAIIAKGQTITENTTFREYAAKISNIETGVDTSDATASQNHILTGYTAYIASGKVSGSLANNGVLNYTPSTSSQSIPAGYTSGGTIEAVTSSIDNNIKAENIKKNVTILGVTGSFEGAEDLTAVLEAQTQKIEELETILQNKAQGQGEVKLFESIQDMEQYEATEGDKAVIYIEDTTADPAIYNFEGFYRYDGNDWVKLSADISATDYNIAVDQAENILD